MSEWRLKAGRLSGQLTGTAGVRKIDRERYHSGECQKKMETASHGISVTSVTGGTIVQMAIDRWLGSLIKRTWNWTGMTSIQH